MDKEKLESLLIDYIDGKLNSVDKHYAEQELLRNPASFQLYEQLKEVIHTMNRHAPGEPSPRLRNEFDALIEEEIAKAPKQKVIVMNPWWTRIAAAVALLVVGLGLGFWISDYNQKKEQQAIAKAREEKTTRLVSIIQNNESAGRRLLGVKEALDENEVNMDILKALVRTLNEDANANVRMAALEGLRRFYAEPFVRKSLIESLDKQNDPVLQITLIQILIEMKEKGAVKPLQKIIEGEDLLPAVRDEAQMGILVLS